MNRAAKRRAGRPALALIEEATHLLRTAPAGVLLSYYVGSIPCVLWLLYFWADMSRGAFARDRLLEAALGVAVSYLWMKCWHAVFAAKLRAHLLLEPEDRWTLARVMRLILIQAAVQPVGLFLRPLAAQVLIPYVWTYSFFQNVGVLGDGTRAGLGEIVREAARQAGLWQRQAHAALLSIFLFMLFVWFDICILVGFAPMLLKMFFGIETVFSRNPMAMLNTTTFAATLAGTYLCVDPIRKALFVLRCFHGSSLKSGEDLRVELKTIGKIGRTTLAAILVFCMLFGGPLAAGRAAEPAPQPRVESTELNSALDRVLQRREYAWRLPRGAEVGEAAQKGWFITFFEGLWNKLIRTVKQVFKWIGKVWDWLRKAFDREPRPRESTERGGINWSATARWTLILLIAALVIILGVLLWRWRQGRRAEVAIAQPMIAVPDLNEESVTADQLPEDGWLQMARDLMQRGELRLALRAFYLAGLAHLGHRELIRIARHKSNRDYDRELRRRARGNSDLLSAFDSNLLVFEAAWYGEHAVTSETLGGFSQNLERIRAC
jgi:hypothetical protein